MNRKIKIYFFSCWALRALLSGANEDLVDGSVGRLRHGVHDGPRDVVGVKEAYRILEPLASLDATTVLS
jgi:hypothetical protein